MNSRSKRTEDASSEQLYAYGLRLLTGRDYAAGGLARKLSARSTDAAVVAGVIGRLTQEGWLDDRRFARNFAEQAQQTGRYVGIRLRQELRRRGVPVDLIQEVMENLPCEQGDEAQIRQLLMRKYPGIDLPPASDRERRRMISFLQRRGFGMAAVFRVVVTDGYAEE